MYVAKSSAPLHENVGDLRVRRIKVERLNFEGPRRSRQTTKASWPERLLGAPKLQCRHTHGACLPLVIVLILGSVAVAVAITAAVAVAIVLPRRIATSAADAATALCVQRARQPFRLCFSKR